MRISVERWDDLIRERHVSDGYINNSQANKADSGWHYEDYASGRMHEVLVPMMEVPSRSYRDVIFDFVYALDEEERKLKIDLLQEAIDL